MKITEKKNEGLKRVYGIAVAAADIAGKIETKFDEIAKTIALPGFRPGKAPRSLLKKKYEGAVRGEVAEDEINRAMENVIKEKSLKPAYRPEIKVESFKDNEDLVFEMSLEVLPDVQIKPFEEIDPTKSISTTSPFFTARLESIFLYSF